MLNGLKVWNMECGVLRAAPSNNTVMDSMGEIVHFTTWPRLWLLCRTEVEVSGAVAWHTEIYVPSTEYVCPGCGVDEPDG